MSRKLWKAEVLREQKDRFSKMANSTERGEAKHFHIINNT